MAKIKNLIIIGAKYGKLTIIEDAGYEYRWGVKNRIVKCRCDCGNEVTRMFQYLTSGILTACGCVRRALAREGKVGDRARKHGLYKHPLFKIWAGMLRRCYGKNYKSAHLYAKEGVTVCDEWRHDFKAFYDWAIDKWQKGLHLDKDKKAIPGKPKIYSPETCSFITQLENNRSTRKNINVTYNGETMCVAAWAKKLGLDRATVKHRLKNWGVELALSTPKVTKYEERVIKGSQR